jgi:hypothetical protein
VAYPVHTSRTVGEAFKSIAGAYTLVRGYDTATHSWRPLGSNDRLEFGKGYEITVTRAVTWRLKGDGVTANVAAAAQAAAAPAIYAGEVVGDTGRVPKVGAPVVVRVDGQTCGQGGTLADGERVVYVVYVAADAGMAGCGAPGRVVTVEVDGKVIATRVWDILRAQDQQLQR